MDEISEIRILIREDNEENRYFDDEEIRFHFIRNKRDIEATAYSLLLIKSEDDSCKLPSGIEVASNSEYWLRLASAYRPNGSRVI